jgi:hypothetical protein
LTVLDLSWRISGGKPACFGATEDPCLKRCVWS